MVFMQEEPPGGGSPACDPAPGPDHAPREHMPHGIRLRGWTSERCLARSCHATWHAHSPRWERIPVASWSARTANPARTRNNEAEDRLENEKRFEFYGTGAPTW